MKPELLQEVLVVLAQAGREDLVARVHQDTHVSDLGAGQAASLLGVSSPAVVHCLREHGHLPGAYRTSGGDWRFPRSELVALRPNLRGVLVAIAEAARSTPRAEAD